MADKETENANLAPPVAEPAGVSAKPEPENAPHEHKHFVSAGTKIHNEVTYRGIDWLLNSSVGVAFAYWSARTPSGEKYFQKPVSGVFEKMLKPVLKSVEGTREGAKWGTMFAGIMAGGFAIIPGIMLMENKNVKKKVINTLDEVVYGKETVKTDPRFQQCYDAIDDEPEKKFLTGLASRLVAVTPLIIASSTPAVNKRLIKYIYDPIGKGTKWVAHKVGIKPGSMAVKGAMEHLDGDPNSVKQFQSNWDFMHRTLGFDFGLTVVYSILHEISYKWLAKAEKKLKAPDAEPQPHSHPQAEPGTSALAASPVESSPALAHDESRSSPAKFASSVSRSSARSVQPREKLSEPAASHTQRRALETASNLVPGM